VSDERIFCLRGSRGRALPIVLDFEVLETLSLSETAIIASGGEIILRFASVTMLRLWTGRKGLGHSINSQVAVPTNVVVLILCTTRTCSIYNSMRTRYSDLVLKSKEAEPYISTHHDTASLKVNLFHLK
jgi:hypothetical protein